MNVKVINPDNKVQILRQLRSSHFSFGKSTTSPKDSDFFQVSHLSSCTCSQEVERDDPGQREPD